MYNDCTAHYAIPTPPFSARRLPKAGARGGRGGGGLTGLKPVPSDAQPIVCALRARSWADGRVVPAANLEERSIVAVPSRAGHGPTTRHDGTPRTRFEGVEHLEPLVVHDLIQKKACTLIDLRSEDRAAGLIEGAAGACAGCDVTKQPKPPTRRRFCSIWERWQRFLAGEWVSGCMADMGKNSVELRSRVTTHWQEHADK